jgi:hypothetical protein
MQKSKRQTTETKKSKKFWSKQVTEQSNALDLEEGVFTRSPREIALSLKRSADASERRKTTPFRSAMSMLTFYQNRAGNNLSKAQIKILDSAKNELRKLYGREMVYKSSRGTKRAH